MSRLWCLVTAIIFGIGGLICAITDNPDYFDYMILFTLWYIAAVLHGIKEAK